MERIIVRRPAEEPLEYPLYRDRTRIGSDPWNEISLPDGEGVAGSHAELLRSPSGCFIVDLDSGSGTFVNGARVKEKELRDGDRITIGGCTLVCLDANSPFAAEALAPAAQPAAEPSPLATADYGAAPAPSETAPPAAPEPEESAPALPQEPEPAAEAAIQAGPEPAPPAEAAAPASEETAAPAPQEPEPAAAGTVEPEFQPEASAPVETAGSEDSAPAVEPPPAQRPEEPPTAEPPAAAAEPEAPAAATDENEATLVLPRRADEDAAAEAPAAEPPPPAPVEQAEPPPAAELPPSPEVPVPGKDENEATIILQRKAPEPAVPEAAPAPAPAASAAPASPGEKPAEADKFAVTSIMKVPKKRPAAAVPASQELEEGVIEIEVREAPLVSRDRAVKAAWLAGAAAFALAGFFALRSPWARAALLPASELRFTVEPAAAQVFVNGAEMPRPGSGVLRGLPAGRYSVRVSHSSYPGPRTAEVETGLFRRRADIEASPAGIIAR